MPNFWGKPSESFNSYAFAAKLYMKGCNIDYTRPENQARVVAIMSSGLRGGAASFLTHRLMIDNLPIRDLDEFEQVFCDAFAPSDQQQRLRDALRACRQTAAIEDYVARFREIIMQVHEMSQPDRVDHFIAGLKPETQKEVNYLNCETLRDAIAAAQAYERAHFGVAPPHRPRPRETAGRIQNRWTYRTSMRKKAMMRLRWLSSPRARRDRLSTCAAVKGFASTAARAAIALPTARARIRETGTLNGCK